MRVPPQAPPPTCGLSGSERLSDGPGSHSCERWSRDLNPCSIHYTPLPLVEKRQGSVMERARAEWQTGPPCGHGVVLGSPAVAEVVAGPVPRAWPCARRAGWAAGPRGLLRSWVTSCCSGSGSRGEGGGRRGFLQGAEPEGLLEVGPAVFEDSVLVPAESLVSLWNSLCVCVCVCVCVHQSFPMLCDPMDCSPPGSSVHGIFQARILQWVATPFSQGSFRPRDRTHVSCVSCIAGRFFAR